MAGLTAEIPGFAAETETGAAGLADPAVVAGLGADFRLTVACGTGLAGEGREILAVWISNPRRPEIFLQLATEKSPRKAGEQQQRTPQV
jgi:hypothetical protein